MKIALSTYSLNQWIESGQITQLGCVAKAAELGFDAIEFVDVLPHDGSSKEEYAQKLAAECQRYGLPVANYTVAADLLNGSGGSLDAEVERVCREIDLALLLGAKSVRHDAAWGFAGKRGFQSFDTVLPRLVEGVRRITVYAAQKGVRTMVENHGLFAQDSDRVEKLVSGVAHENFGLLCDMGNFLCAGEDPAFACGRAAPYAFYAHAKDFHIKSGMEPDPGEGFFRTRRGDYLRGAIIGQGNVPVRQCLAILKDAGYDGFIGLEFEGIEDCGTGVRIGLANLRRYIGDVYKQG